MSTFERAYEAHRADIRRLSRKQWVPGMEPDDVENEMLVVLWKAVETYDETRGSLWGRWWTMWGNRRKNLLEAFYAASRPRTTYTSALPDPVWVDYRAPSLPPRYHGVHQEVWRRLACGDTAKEVKADLGLSQRGYYDVIHQLRADPQVRSVLSD